MCDKYRKILIQQKVQKSISLTLSLADREYTSVQNSYYVSEASNDGKRLSNFINKLIKIFLSIFIPIATF